MPKCLDEWTQQDFEQLNIAFEKDHGPTLGNGRHRAVYKLNDAWVLKVPTRHSGISANYHEDSWSGGPKYAKAHLNEVLSEKFGIPILQMEFVTHRGWSKRSDWTWGIDGGQVGFTRDGRLVAYDWEHY